MSEGGKCDVITTPDGTLRGSVMPLAVLKSNQMMFVYSDQ